MCLEELTCGWSGVRVAGALPPFPTPTEPPISYPIFRMTLFMSPRASSALLSERRMLKGRERPDLAKANHVAEKGYRTSVEPLPPKAGVKPAGAKSDEERVL